MTKKEIKAFASELKKKGFRLNKSLLWMKKANINNFTTSFGISFRKLFMHKILELVAYFDRNSYRNIIDVKLDKNKSYIFASTHAFADDALGAFNILGRNAYAIIGSHQTLEINRDAYLLWMSGSIFVDVLDKESRKGVVPKAKRVLDAGGNILIFPEGCWNTSESKVVGHIFRGAIDMADLSGAEIVPIGSYRDDVKNEVLVKMGKPFSVKDFDSLEDARRHLRNELATLKWYTMEELSKPIKRDDLDEKSKFMYYEGFRSDFLLLPWSRDTWKEEVNYYVDDCLKYQRIESSTLSNLDLRSDNSFLAKSVLNHRKLDFEYKNYELVNILENTWQMNRKELSDYVLKVYGVSIKPEEFVKTRENNMLNKEE